MKIGAIINNKIDAKVQDGVKIKAQMRVKVIDLNISLNLLTYRKFIIR